MKNNPSKNCTFEAYTGDNPYIFVSYAHEDSRIVCPELERFHNDGFNIWYDEGITSGMGWQEVVEKSLINCSLFVVFMSDNAIESQNVREEIFLAINEEKPVIPIYLEETELKYGLKLKLNSIQSILKYRMSDEDYVRTYLKDFKQFLGSNTSKSNKQEPKNFENTNENDFDYLNALIHMQDSAEKISLDKDIIINSKDIAAYTNAINLDRNNLIIDGNGHTIDACDFNPIFRICANNITLKNIKFKNANFKEGSALLVEENTSLNIVSCEFENNRSGVTGGAIRNNGHLTINNSVFINNKSLSGGAIYNDFHGVLMISNSKFMYNQGQNGGAIFNNGKMIINDSNFNDNIGLANGGALINFEGECDIIHSIFNKNWSKSDYKNNGGGAIVNYNGKMLIEKSQYKNNFSQNHGGAILNDGHSIQILKSKFENNASQKSGGAIFNLNGTIFIPNSKFKENSSRHDGYSLFNTENGIIDIGNSEFVNSNKYQEIYSEIGGNILENGF